MKKSIFAVCDLEASYSCRLMEYIHEKQGKIFEVQAFTSVKNLCEFAKEQEIELLLISTQAMCDEIRKLPIGKIMILSEGEQLEELSNYPCIYKYQASDHLLAEVMSCYADQKPLNPLPLLKKGVRIVGIYSPVKRVLKTSFALTLGQILAKDRAVLYLNLESYSGFPHLLRKEFKADISDLMYFVRRGSDSLIFKLGSMVQSLNNLDYLPPAVSAADIRSVSGEEWSALLDTVKMYSAYDTIILDLDEILDGLPGLLRQCDVIYMPVREDGISIAKIRQYEKMLELQEYEDVLKKTKKLKLPFHSSFGSKEHYLEELIWSELGDFVRTLIREGEMDERYVRTDSGI